MAPHPRTLQRHFAALGLTRSALSASNVAFGRFEATHPNELWVGDALHGPVIGGKKAILFWFLDDHSRLVTGHRWTHAEDTLSAESALRRGILSRGVPGTVYLDNGSSFVSKQLLRALAILGARLVHSRPGRPQGRGKIERVFRTVRDQFLVDPRSKHHVTAGELVIESMEPTCWVLLGTAVEHALEGLKITDTFVSRDISCPCWTMLVATFVGLCRLI